MINTKKITALGLTAAMMLSLCACNSNDPAEISEAADSFAAQVAALDGKKLLKLVEELDDDKAESIKGALAMSDMDDDEKSVKTAIASTITYEVDEDSVEFGGNDSATVDVVFTVVDYVKAIGDLTDADEMIEAINDASKTKDYTVSVEFTKVDDKWLVTEDTIDNLEDVYGFLSYELSFSGSSASGDILDMVDHTSWWLSDGGNYSNASYIELDLWFTENPGIDVYYKVTKDGTEVYASQLQTFTTSYYEAKYNEELGATMDGDYIAAGNYTIEIYAADGTVLASESTTVTVDSTSGSTSGTQTGGTTTDTYQLLNPNFANIVELGWWDYGITEADGSEHGTMASDGVYCSDSETIAFSIELSSEGPSIYYAYYFIPGENADVSTVDYSNPTYAQQIDITAYGNGTIYYNIDYTPDTMAVGTYVLIVAADANSINDPYITAACKVIGQPSSDFIN